MRLVDLDEIKTPMPGEETGFSEMLDYIEELKDADKFDIVFCPYCRNSKICGGSLLEGGYYYCKKRKCSVDETDFCSWGIFK